MDVPADRRAIQAAVEGLAEENHVLMSRRPFPRLYTTAVLYRREDAGNEDWQNAAKLMRAMVGDCEDLAAYRVAELRAYEGEPARVRIVPTQRGSFHAIVQRASGELEDPSRWQIARERQGYMNAPKFTLRDEGAYWVAGVDFPYGNGKTQIEEVGWDPVAALKSVVSKAAKVMESPEVQALMPPQVAIAFKTVHALSNMSPRALRRIMEDDRSTDAQRALAAQLLKGGAAGAAAGAESSTSTTPKDEAKQESISVNSCQCPEPPTAADVAGWMLGDTVRDHRDRTTGPGGKPKYAPSTLPPAAPPPRAERLPANSPATDVPARGPIVDPATGAQIDPVTGMPIPGSYPGTYPGTYPGYPGVPGAYPGTYPGYPAYPYPGYAVPFDPYNPYGVQATTPSVLMPEDMQALAVWGAGAFAPDSYQGVPGIQTQDQMFGYTYY